MHRVPRAQGLGASHGSNPNSDNRDDSKRAANTSAALQGATLAFASRTDQKQMQSSNSSEATIPTRQPAGRTINNGARQAAMIADAATNNRATGARLEAGEEELDDPSSCGIGAVKDRIQLFSSTDESGGSTTAAPVPQPAESAKSATSLRNGNPTTYRNTTADSGIVTQPKLGLNNPQHIAAKLAVDRSAVSKSKSKSGSGSSSPRPAATAAATTTISSRRTREYQELITHDPQRALGSSTTCDADIDISSSSWGARKHASLSSEVTEARESSAAQNMPAQQKYGVNAAPPLPNRSVAAGTSSPRKKMDSESDRGSVLSPPPPPPPPPSRLRSASPPPALPPRSSMIHQTKEKPPPPAPRHSAAASASTSSIIDNPATPRGPLPSLPRPLPHPHPHPHTQTQTRPIPLQPQNSGVSGSSLADAIAASSLASSRTPSPSKQTQPPLPPSRRSRSRSFLHVTHSGNKNDHRRDLLRRQRSPSRTPSPSKTTAMKRTMRAPAQPEPDFAGGGHRSREHSHRRIIRTHPHKHREGDRKRWRDQVTGTERKRYEGVWAANKGLFIDVHEQVNLKDKSAVLEEMVTSMVVRDIWTRSRLPTHMLEQIWNLVSHHAYGLLSREEFVVGMWLIDQCLKGHKLPVKVSQSVWDSVRSVSAESMGHH
ncbi:uncharacterized protein GIQ15_02807 [Arthroderma uncinatum]|uniref:uncharacterized protein n=1 Tax=Arthroderma uncinatum TaxID=74035 RepID=UPI00144A635C|nr:uncharacterized protein GIQ15_02807 [Arthroderma uncinatum]KAF3483483.1 hypothetical protein GIQ15_02807 [Arthroderma uncinatum]